MRGALRGRGVSHISRASVSELESACFRYGITVPERKYQKRTARTFNSLNEIMAHETGQRLRGTLFALYRRETPDPLPWSECSVQMLRELMATREQTRRAKLEIPLRRAVVCIEQAMTSREHWLVPELGNLRRALEVAVKKALVDPQIPEPEPKPEPKPELETGPERGIADARAWKTARSILRRGAPKLKSDEWWDRLAARPRQIGNDMAEVKRQHDGVVTSLVTADVRETADLVMRIHDSPTDALVRRLLRDAYPRVRDVWRCVESQLRHLELD